MRCSHPIGAYQVRPGSPLFFGKIPPRGSRGLYVPCGKCIACRLERSRQDAVRCMHEASLHKVNAFVTLTYSDEFLPEFGHLCHDDYVLFQKRLVYYEGATRYFMCGEYGERFCRPHYHSILFGYFPVDALFYKNGASGFPIYRSASLDKMWRLGAAYVGRVSFESAAYVARYCLPKTGDGKFTDIVDVTTGEIHIRPNQYGRRSLKPGIGAGWIDKHGENVYARDSVIMNGARSRSPRYYDKRFNMTDVGRMYSIKRNRALKVDDDWSYRQLRDEEVVLGARIGLLHRDFE